MEKRSAIAGRHAPESRIGAAEDTPAHIRRLLERCLRKTPSCACDIGDARLALDRRTHRGAPPAQIDPVDDCDGNLRGRLARDRRDIGVDSLS